eukprot:790181-Pleurochrysis_carterae.AAC.1
MLRFTVILFRQYPGAVNAVVRASGMQVRTACTNRPDANALLADWSHVARVVQGFRKLYSFSWCLLHSIEFAISQFQFDSVASSRIELRSPLFNRMRGVGRCARVCVRTCARISAHAGMGESLSV